MSEWKGKWKGGWFPHKCQCDCGKEGGAEIYEQTFDADDFDSMIHDGETRIVKKIYLCEECVAKYGKEVNHE